MAEIEPLSSREVRQICFQSSRHIKARIPGLLEVLVGRPNGVASDVLVLEFKSQRALTKAGDITPMLQKCVRHPEMLPRLHISRRVAPHP